MTLMRKRNKNGFWKELAKVARPFEGIAHGSTARRDDASALVTWRCTRRAHSDAKNEIKSSKNKKSSKTIFSEAIKGTGSNKTNLSLTWIAELAAANSSHMGGCDSRHFMTATRGAPVNFWTSKSENDSAVAVAHVPAVTIEGVEEPPCDTSPSTTDRPGGSLPRAARSGSAV
jgi:hypothetical protein